MTGSLRETGLNQLLTSLNFHENLPIHHILVTEKGAKIEEKLLNQYTFWIIDRKNYTYNYNSNSPEKSYLHFV